MQITSPRKERRDLVYGGRKALKKGSDQWVKYRNRKKTEGKEKKGQGF